MTAPLPYERQDPQAAAFLASLYAQGSVFVAYAWKQGFRTGLGRTPLTPSHDAVIITRDGRVLREGWNSKR